MEISSFIEMILITFEIIFDLWPIMMLGALFKSRRGRVLRYLLANWSLWAVVRVSLFFFPEEIRLFHFIPEPLNTQLFFALGAALIGLSVAKRWWKRDKLFRKAGKVRSSNDLVDLSPREFEEMVVQLFSVYGHQAKRTGKAGDHGVDVVVKTKKGERLVVQCKNWRGTVGESVIRDLYGVVHHEKADRGIVIASSEFSKSAIEWARGKPISLYNGQKFLKLWKRAQVK